MTDWSENERLLDRFRTWLDEARTQADELAAEGPFDGERPDVRPVGLFQVIEEFTALRHEVKLQTKGARSLQDQVEAALAGLQQAIERFGSVSAQEDEAARRAAKPMAEALANLDEALERGLQVIENARERILGEAVRQTRAHLDELFYQEPFWRRWAARRYYKAVDRYWFRQVTDSHRGIFGSLIEGYGLIQNRLKRVMKEEGIRRIATVGQQVDPNSMTVVEVVTDVSRPAGQVIEEVRRGYYWKDKVLRFAEVRAVAREGHD